MREPGALENRKTMSHYIQIVTTVGNRESAASMARRLVEERLAACVQIAGPVKSVYRWKGNVETAEEWQCIIKTDQKLYEAVEKRIGDMHPYELPEIIALPIKQGSVEYLGWIGGQTDKR
jgi:periplasmic divalent cation tolerance protein